MFSRLKAWMNRSLPDHGDPRQETPCQAKKRLDHLERKARKARHTIACVYELPDLRGFDRDIRGWTDSTVYYLMQDEKVESLIKGNWISHEDARGAITQAVHDYYEAFVLFRALNHGAPARPEHPRYNKMEARDQLYHLYSNRITNAAEARFISLRVDALDAHELNHRIIKTTIDCAHEMIDKDVHITPPQGRPKTELIAIEQIDQLRDYERRHVQALHRALNPEQYQSTQRRY